MTTEFLKTPFAAYIDPHNIREMLSYGRFAGVIDVMIEDSNIYNANDVIYKLTHRQIRLWGCACVSMVRPLLLTLNPSYQSRIDEGYALAEEPDFENISKLPSSVTRTQPQGSRDILNGLSELKKAAVIQAVKDLDKQLVHAEHSATLTNTHRCIWAAGVEADSIVVSTITMLGCLTQSPHASSAACKVAMFIDIAGKPDNLTSSVSPAARDLASDIYNTNTFDPLDIAVLADMLDDNNSDTRLSAHLRSSSKHVRGCWAIDYLMGY